MAVALVGLILWLVLDTARRPKQLISFAGICMFVIILFACSKHHSAVSLGFIYKAKKATPMTSYLITGRPFRWPHEGDVNSDSLAIGPAVDQ